MIICDACDAEAAKIMEWDTKEGMVKHRLCEECSLLTRKMLDGRYYYMRQIRKAAVVSERDAIVLAAMSSSRFQKAEVIGYPESLLISMVSQGLVVMTKGDSSILFKRRGV